MARTAGARNRDYAEVRHRMASAMAANLLGSGGDLATFADLARAAGVSPTTLKHYFQDRDSAYAAAMASVADDAAGYLRRQVEHALEEPTTSGALRAYLEATVTAWRRHGLGRVFTGTLAWGLAAPHRGPEFLGGMLEPAVGAAVDLLQRLLEREGRTPTDDSMARVRALMILSPVFLAMLHQDNLGGREHHPLDLDELLDAISVQPLG